MAKDVDDALLQDLASRSDGYSCADIAAIVDDAKLIAVIGGVKGTKRVVSKKDMLNAFDRIEGSVTLEDMESSQNFMKVYKVKK